MSRHPQIKSRKRTNGRYYYCRIGGRQYGLGYDLEQAKREFARLFTGGPPVECDDDITIGELVTLFDGWLQSHRSKRTADDYVYWLVRMVADAGADLPARLLSTRHLDDFVARHRIVGTWAHVKVARCVRRLILWAGEQHQINFPLRIKLPRKPESPQRLFTPIQVWYLWRSCSPDIRPLLRWYYATGCRPEESKIRCEWVVVRSRQVVIPAKHAKGKRRRVIHYPPKLDRMIARCLRRSRSGWLFESAAGKPFSTWAIDARHDKIRFRQPALFPDGCNARMWRYTFATMALKRGLGPMTVAHLMGHKNLSMLTAHYEKLGTDREHLAGAIDQIWRGSGQRPHEKRDGGEGR